MRFPLPIDIFPSVILMREDRHALAILERVVLDDAWMQRQELLELRNGVVDKRQWKKLKQIKSLTIHKQRHGVTAATPLNVASPQLPMLMTVGTMTGDLEDVMYGVAGHSLDSMRIKSSYIQDQSVDGAVLATLISPSASDPFRSLQLKWTVQGPRKFMRPFVRLRDYVYLESTGVMTAATGERIGYHLNHSVQLPGVRELEELDIVRAQSSQCFFYCQRDANTLDVFGTSLVHPLGKIQPAYAAQAVAESLASVSRLDHCAQMKKLTWMLKTGVRETSLYRDADGCGVCDRSTKYSLYRKKSCRACLRRVCGNCRVTKRVSTVLSGSDLVLQHALTICKHCLARAHNQSAMAIAACEIARKPDFNAAFSTANFEVTMSVSDGEASEEAFSVADVSVRQSLLSASSSISSSFVEEFASPRTVYRRMSA